jgi:hypothetical protein
MPFLNWAVISQDAIRYWTVTESRCSTATITTSGHLGELKVTKKKPTLRDEVEPVLRDIIGIDDRPANPSSNGLPDPVGDFFHREEWGIDPPRDANAPAAKTPAPLTRAQIAESLQALSKTLGRPRFKNTSELITALAKAAESHLEKGNPIREFLQSYSKADREGMRASVRKLVQASREEILKAVKEGKSPLEAVFFRDDETELSN